jgi:hypothetical protein
MSTPDSATLQERIWDAGVTVERIVHLGVQLVAEHLDYDFMEWLLEDADSALAAALGVSTDELAEAIDQFGTERSARQEAMQESLRPLHGWLVAVSAPRIDWSEDGKSGSVHTGWRTQRVMYADTYEEALEAALSWGEEFTAPPGAGLSNDS